MRVVLVDPAAFTAQYDHALAAALARGGTEVELVTSRIRFGDTPQPVGYRRSELYYPLSSRLFRRSALRLPVRALEHPVGTALALRRPRDLLHVQWLPAARLDEVLFRFRGPSVFTAHDPLPARVAPRPELWRRLLERFDRIVVHSEWGAGRLQGLGLAAERLRVVPHPVFESDPPRADDGRTLLCLGVIRPYKGLGDAIEACRRVEGSRLLVVGDPLEPVEPYRAAAGDRAEWRLGYVPESEVDRALGESTLALFPYLPALARLDQSGAVLRALGAGVPAVVYDVGGIAEPVRRYGAGRVVAAGDVAAFAAAIEELLGDAAALAAARAGAQRARAELTWDAAAAAHLGVYRELS